jgi:large subunit ribosomal protein L10
MATSRKKKESDLEQITSDLEQARGVVFTEYRGMTVKELDNVRKNLRKENVKYQVVKITLLKKVFEKLGLNTDSFKHAGPIAMAVSKEEETAPARILKSMLKDNPKLLINGGLFNKEIVGADVINRLASLPSKQQLLGQLVYVIAGPSRGLVTVLSGNTRSLLNVLNTIAAKKK